MSESYTGCCFCVEIPNADLDGVKQFVKEVALLCVSRRLDDATLIDPTVEWTTEDFTCGWNYELQSTTAHDGGDRLLYSGTLVHIFESMYFEPEMAELAVRELVEHFKIDRPVIAHWICYSDEARTDSYEGNGFVIVRGQETRWVYLTQVLQQVAETLKNVN